MQLDTTDLVIRLREQTFYRQVVHELVIAIGFLSDQPDHFDVEAARMHIEEAQKKLYAERWTFERFGEAGARGRATK